MEGETQLSVGVLGDPRTFAGQAFSHMREAVGRPLSAVYAISLDDLWGWLDHGEIDALLTTAETTNRGANEGYERLLDAPVGRYFVMAEVIVPYRCRLLGKRGARRETLSRIVGHGSLGECEAVLARIAPQAERVRSRTNSVDAATEVLDGDGSVAVVGTRALGEDLGLVTLAPDVDGGSEGAWWLITTSLQSCERPSRLVVRVGLGPDRAAFSEAVAALHERGWRVRTIWPRSLGTKLLEWECLVVFGVGEGGTPELPAVLGDLNADVVGMF